MGKPAVQLKSFHVKGLFGTLNHSISFPVPTDASQHPSVVIVHGLNGVGKTTTLRMLDGLMRLDFNVFRSIPFRSCALEFSPQGVLEVTSVGNKTLECLDVSFGDQKARLHPVHPGPLKETDNSAVEKLRQLFFKTAEDIAFEFIDTERLQQRRPRDPEEELALSRLSERERSLLIHTSVSPNPKARPTRYPTSMAARVQRFIREAQVNYRTFFATTQPDLFPRIIERLTSTETTSYNLADLRTRLEHIHAADEEVTRLGLERDAWNFKQLMERLTALQKRRGAAKAQALMVLGTYVEQLESRAAERALVTARLLTFERLMAEFLGDNRVTINAKNGLRITARSGAELQETQLSSGEYHLLFLMVAALVTRRRGTVIAIDEPEMSMHIAWQRNLVRALVDCASRANPLFIFATHSPDLAASYPDGAIELK